jgi:hypothetical protein
LADTLHIEAKPHAAAVAAPLSLSGEVAAFGPAALHRVGMVVNCRAASPAMTETA